MSALSVLCIFLQTIIHIILELIIEIYFSVYQSNVVVYLSGAELPREQGGTPHTYRTPFKGLHIKDIVLQILSPYFYDMHSILSFSPSFILNAIISSLIPPPPCPLGSKIPFYTGMVKLS